MSLRSVLSGAPDPIPGRGARGGTASGRPDRAAGPDHAGRPAEPAPQLALDPIACVGHGLCAELFPEGVVLDDWGYPILVPEAQDPALREHARRAAKACPALALKLRARGRVA